MESRCGGTAIRASPSRPAADGSVAFRQSLFSSSILLTDCWQSPRRGASAPALSGATFCQATLEFTGCTSAPLINSHNMIGNSPAARASIVTLS